MKKLFSAVCITLCLLFSSAATAVRADEGDGHAPGYVCIETIETADCPPNEAPPQQQQSETFGSNIEDATDTPLTLLELIITLLPKG
jgi:hypothetical protein